jgi:phage N-6-adenine-methyltransferase
MPQQRPSQSRQDYGTPWDFIRAVEARFGEIICDLAADASNAKCSYFFDETRDSLKQNWASLFPDGTLWLNPPFNDIETWAAKCALESPKRRGLIVMLTPASIGSAWFHNHVHRKAMVLGLRPRMTFDGTPPNPKTGRPDPYPKDLSLSVYGMGLNGFDTWRWK